MHSQGEATQVLTFPLFSLLRQHPSFRKALSVKRERKRKEKKGKISGF
jgi:hypothetical protein